MPARCVTVDLPCHALDGLAAVEPHEAEAFLAAWTTAWQPGILAQGQGVPAWRPMGSGSGSASDPALSDPLAGGDFAEDFQALGLAVLLAEMLARRMRVEAGLETTGFAELAVAAAAAAVAGDGSTVRERLAEAFACLEATRARYYPVDSWAVDAVLLAPRVNASRAAADLAGPVPLAVVATGETLRRLAAAEPGLISAVRAAVAEGRIEPCGGRDDQQPLDQLSPEAMLDSFHRGRAAWQEILAVAPVCYAAIGGGSSALVPQLLTSLGYRAALWSLCDGSALPDPGGGRILWEGTGGGAIEAVARMPLDASRGETVLAIPDALGDAMDHDHVAVIQFASYAGGASRWHRLVRRIGSWSPLLGRFVTPSTLIDETAGSATTAALAADAFPSALPVEREAIPDLVAATAAQARNMLAREQGHRPLLPVAGPRLPRDARAQSARSGLWRRLSGRRPAADSLVLDNGLVRVEAHPRTGGILAVRRPEDRANRLSQQIALRTTRSPRPGASETPDERAAFTRMEADAIEREREPGGGRLVSRGRLVAATGQDVGRYWQQVSLVAGLPLALIDLEVTLERPLHGSVFEESLACRFAWHENESVELRRSLHLQAIATERTRFAAPHFVEIVPEAVRRPEAAVVILTGGLPWHLRSSPHVLDSLLATTGTTAAARLAVGVGLERPWEAAVALAAGGLPQVGPRLPRNVRLTAADLAAGPTETRHHVGLVESGGVRGEVRIEWARTVRRCTAVDASGRPLSHVHVAVDGPTTVVFLDRYQWLHLEIEFAEPAPEPLDRLETSA